MTLGDYRIQPYILDEVFIVLSRRHIVFRSKSDVHVAR